MRCKLLLSAIAFVLIVVLTTGALGGSILFTGEIVHDRGPSFENPMNVLSVAAPHWSTKESGKVGWDGADMMMSGDATHWSDAPMAETIMSYVPGKPGSFTLILNIRESACGDGGTIGLRGFSADFYSPEGAMLFSAPYSSGRDPTNLTMVDNGLGGAGYAFQVNLSRDESAMFFGNPQNRLGVTIRPNDAIEWVSGGAETFYLDKRPFVSPDVPPDPPPDAPVVPIPNSLMMGAFGLATLCAWKAWRRWRTSW